jgi:hypothetical protein
MAQQPRNAEIDDQPTRTAAAARQNQPKQVETYERPARTARVSGLVMAIAVLVALVIVAVLFF